MSASKLRARELITIAIFSVIFYLVMRAGALIGMIPPTFPYTSAVQLTVCGIVWVYLRTKVPKAFAVTLQCALLALVTFVGGTAWYLALSMFAGGLAAELVLAIGRYGRGWKLQAAAYAAFGLCFNFGCFGVMLLARDYYREFVLAAGMDPEYVERVLAVVSWKTFAVSSVLSIIGATAGTLLGRLLFKKHFAKVGMI
ncbi:MAG: MptD family putative ECF transporter S component [Oscillospiraceae bacterium]|jgi:energy-coupling factor transport system substrate-specific component|nr:MptD family putative ECF transporter S component [Oscillospiraceae bacterium]